MKECIKTLLRFFIADFARFEGEKKKKRIKGLVVDWHSINFFRSRTYRQTYTIYKVCIFSLYLILFYIPDVFFVTFSFLTHAGYEEKELMHQTFMRILMCVQSYMQAHHVHPI